MHRLLVVTAVAAEQAAVLGDRRPDIRSVAGLQLHRVTTGAGLVDVATGGVGAVAAALSTARLLARAAEPVYDLVIAAGIGGGFASVEIGSLVVASEVVHADLGAETADAGFSSLAELGFGPVRFPVEQLVTEDFAQRLAARTGAVLTVSMATGTQARADRLLAQYPDAVAEGMEGAGICQAANQAGVPFAEIRAISNRVGPRHRSNWRIDDALGALGTAFDKLLAQPMSISDR